MRHTGGSRHTACLALLPARGSDRAPRVEPSLAATSHRSTRRHPRARSAARMTPPRPAPCRRATPTTTSTRGSITRRARSPAPRSFAGAISASRRPTRCACTCTGTAGATPRRPGCARRASPAATTTRGRRLVVHRSHARSRWRTPTARQASTCCPASRSSSRTTAIPTTARWRACRCRRRCRPAARSRSASPGRRACRGRLRAPAPSATTTFIAHWFPKVAVFEGGRWTAHQFHANTEFFADYGRYDVRLTVPRGWIVGATGTEQSRTDNADGTTTHRYVQDDVHDFAWTTSPDYVEHRADDSNMRAAARRDAAAAAAGTSRSGGSPLRGDRGGAPLLRRMVRRRIPTATSP